MVGVSDDKATTDLKLFGVNLKVHSPLFAAWIDQWVVGRISLSIKTKLQKQKLHDEESGAKYEEIERKMEIGQRLGCLEEETKRIALIREKEVALVRKKIDFVNKEFSTSQSVKLPPPAKNPQGDLEKVKRGLRKIHNPVIENSVQP
ncbi:hypothetical protein YC2023_050040 [Brassica napus]